ncbi:MAG: tetratricopeptide repeat protein [Vicinamibacterales bacterium]
MLLLVASACRNNDALTKAEALQRGDELVERKQYGEAIAFYQAAVASDPRDGVARLKLASTYRYAERWGEAIREGIRAADLLPDDQDAQLLGIWSLLSQERYLDVVERASVMLKRTPDSPALLVHFANAKARFSNSTFVLSRLDEAWRLGRDAESVRLHLRPEVAQSDDRAAEAAFRRALEIDPTMSDARLGLAGLLWAVGRLDDGAVVLQEQADEEPGHAFLNRTLGLFYVSRSRHAEAEKYLKVAAALGDRDSRLALADFFIRGNRGEEALPILNEIAAGEDPGAGVALRAADIELRLGRREQALQRAEKILAREPNNPRALRIKAEVLFSSGAFDQALRVADAAVAAGPGASEARAVLARSLLATGDLGRAFDEFAEAYRLNPSDAQVTRDLANLALALNRDKVALEFARTSVRLDPNDRGASVALVKALIRARDFSTADRTLAPLLAKESTSADLLVLLAAIQASRGGHDVARSTYLRALQADRHSFEAVSGLVALELEDRQIARARQRIDQAVLEHPSDPGYLLLAVRVSRAEGDAPRAESTLRTILAKDPAHVVAALELADVLTRQNRREDATRVIDQALARRPSSLELQVVQANLLEETGHIAEARTRYEKIVAAHADAYAVSARLAALYANQGDNLDVALGLASTAKQGAPDDPAMGDALGWVYVRKGLPRLAIQHLEEAVRAEPANALFRYHLGIAYQKGSQSQKARGELTRALGLDPNFPGAADARAALNTLSR